MSLPARQATGVQAQLLFAMRYYGRALHGTALQPSVPTAAGLVIARVRRHLHPARLWALSVTARLDAGVHAELNLLSLRIGLARDRPNSLALGLAALEADTDDALTALVGAATPCRLSARGLAVSKTYRYVVEDGYDNAAMPAPWLQQDVWRVAPRLNHARLQRAADVFVGEHNFTAFAASPKRRGQSPAQAVKRIFSLEVRAVGQTEHGGTRWHIVCCAAGLLRRQMRFMAASIVCAGAQLTDAAKLKSQLAAATPPAQRAPQAPGCGLYLVALDCRGPAAPLAAALSARLQLVCDGRGLQHPARISN